MGHLEEWGKYILTCVALDIIDYGEPIRVELSILSVIYNRWVAFSTPQLPQPCIWMYWEDTPTYKQKHGKQKGSGSETPILGVSISKDGERKKKRLPRSRVLESQKSPDFATSRMEGSERSKVARRLWLGGWVYLKPGLVVCR